MTHQDNQGVTSLVPVGSQYAQIISKVTAHRPLPDNEPVQSALPLAHYLWVLKRNRWRLLAFTIFCVVATLLVSLRTTPIYQAVATVDIDRQTAPGIIGQEATRIGPRDADQYLATQIKLVQSDAVLRPVAEKYGLRKSKKAQKDPEMAARVSAAPVSLADLKVARPPNTYLLLISYRSIDPKQAADVANAVAQSYIDTTLDMRIKDSMNLSEIMDKQIEELKAKMERSNSAVGQLEHDLNAIDPEQKTSILSARLLQLNTEYTHAQADRVKKEAAVRSLRAGSLEAVLSGANGDSFRGLTERLNEAQERFTQVRVQYGANHPEYRKAEAQLTEIQRLLESTRQNIARRVDLDHKEALDREQMLEKAVVATKAEFDGLNSRYFQYRQMKRDAEADKRMYEELVTKIKQAGINAIFQKTAVRIADIARPPVTPIAPNVRLNVILAFLISIGVGVGAALIADMLDNTVRDADEIARSLKTEVIGTLPCVRTWRKRMVPVSIEANSSSIVKLDRSGDTSIAGFAESMRSLRNSILLADFDRRLKTILLTSAAPAEGKSTTAAYLALAHAQQGKKTLIIDGDLRRPSVHRRFELPSGTGLSNVLLGEINWRDGILPITGTPNLDVLPAGPSSRRASDLIGSDISALLEEMSREYDLVIVDAPPLLGFAESLQMATCVDGVLLVARAGETNRKAIASVVASLQRLRVNILGLVLNEVKKESAAGYYYGDYRRYYNATEVVEG